MSRLDEIKASIELKKTLKTRGLHHGGQQEIDDIEYLLNEVERLKSALESVRNAPAREIMRNYAERALNAENTPE